MQTEDMCAEVGTNICGVLPHEVSLVNAQLLFIFYKCCLVYNHWLSQHND